MDVRFDKSQLSLYNSPAQIARVLTEAWVKKNIYCPSCGNDELNKFNNNCPVADFLCSSCKSEYELKSKKNSFSTRIVDGAYGSMIKRINSNNNPHFFFLNYSFQKLEVLNLIVIPKHYFVDDVIEKRKPLNVSARRAGWIGCNILLNNIPSTGKIFLVKEGKFENRNLVIERWAKTSFLANQRKESRSWAIEVLKIIESTSYQEFSIADVYGFESYFKQKFPNNNFIREKLRQQLQVLRDKGIITFNGRGCYKKI